MTGYEDLLTYGDVVPHRLTWKEKENTVWNKTIEIPVYTQISMHNEWTANTPGWTPNLKSILFIWTKMKSRHLSCPMVLEMIHTIFVAIVWEKMVRLRAMKPNIEHNHHHHSETPHTLKRIHTMDMLWEQFHWILPLYMKPINFQSKASVVCSVTTALLIDFCLKKLNVFSQQFGKKTNEYLNSTEKITRNWNVNLVSMLITSWDIT